MIHARPGLLRGYRGWLGTTAVPTVSSWTVPDAVTKVSGVPTGMLSALARLCSRTIVPALTPEPSIWTGTLMFGGPSSPASKTRTSRPSTIMVPVASGTERSLSATPGSVATVRASASDETFASTCAPWAASKVRSHGSCAVAPTSRVRTIVAAAAPVSMMVSTLASRRERIPENESLTRMAIMPVRRAQGAVRPGEPRQAPSRYSPDHRGA